jgi:hypothetical protein
MKMEIMIMAMLYCQMIVPWKIRKRSLTMPYATHWEGNSLGGASAILFLATLLFHKTTKLMEILLAIYVFVQPKIGD